MGRCLRPLNIMHGVVCIEAGELFDVFSLMREDFGEAIRNIFFYYVFVFSLMILRRKLSLGVISPLSTSNRGSSSNFFNLFHMINILIVILEQLS